MERSRLSVFHCDSLDSPTRFLSARFWLSLMAIRPTGLLPFLRFAATAMDCASTRHPTALRSVNSSSATAGELAPRGSGTISGPFGSDIVNNSGQLVTFNCPVRFYSFGAEPEITDIQYIKTTSGNIGFNTGAFFAGTTDFALGANGGTLDFSATAGNTITVGASSTPGVIWAGGTGAGGLIKEGAGTLVLAGNAARCVRWHNDP